MTYISKKRGLHALAACLAMVFTTAAGQTARATELPQTYYETREVVTISKNVTYEKSRTVTSDGLLDVHILRVPLNDPYIHLETVQSQTGLGLRETTSALVNAANGIAGVNGDFFISDGKYSMPVGLSVANGTQAATASTNKDAMRYASFLLTNTGSAFIEYVRTEINVLFDGAPVMPIVAFNRLATFNNPVYLDNSTMADTAQLDARNPALYKIIVENGIVTRISEKGETVTLPANGFIIVQDEAAFKFYKTETLLHKRAEAIFRPSVDTSAIQTAISGAGKILANGEPIADGHIVTGRQPRTAIGISRDGQTAILMVVDGRTHSIGATHDELAALLLREGAYNAMHLDGGGSSGMAVQAPGEADASMVNRPSDGAQRAVVNALSVQNNAPVGTMERLIVEPAADTAAKGIPLALDVYGLDAYAHRVEIPLSDIRLSASEGAAIQNGSFVAQKSGVHTIQAEYGGFTAQAAVTGVEIAALTYTGAPINIAQDGTRALSFTGASGDGFTVTPDAAFLQYEVFPASIGEVINGVFRVTGAGAGYVQCRLGSAVTYIPVRTASVVSPLDPLDGAIPVTFSANPPDTVVGVAMYAADLDPGRMGEQQSVLGSAAGTAQPDNALTLTYLFPQSSATQAAYAVLGDGVTTNADGFRVSVYGTGSGHWIRGLVVDAKGQNHFLTFTERADFEGWQDLDAMLPASAARPVTLTHLYAASLSESAPNLYRLAFNNLRALTNLDTSGVTVELPADSTAQDEMQVAFYDNGANADVTILGKLWHAEGSHSHPDYAAERKQAITAALRGASTVLYAGAADLKPETNNANIRSNPGAYGMAQVNGVTLFTMASAGGGFTIADASQWSYIAADLQAAQTNIVVIQTDINPLDFKHKQETELFHELLLANANGKTIFVVSASGTSTWAEAREGIRYINLGCMYDRASPNAGFAILRLRVQNGAVKFGLEPLWP